MLSGRRVAQGLKMNFDAIVDALNGDFKASQVKFTDGQTFQQKLDAGTLKGDKGETGAQITSIELTITGGTNGYGTFG